MSSMAAWKLARVMLPPSTGFAVLGVGAGLLGADGQGRTFTWPASVSDWVSTRQFVASAEATFQAMTAEAVDGVQSLLAVPTAGAPPGATVWALGSSAFPNAPFFSNVLARPLRLITVAR